MNWWVHSLFQSGRYAELLSWIFWVLFSITLHELAHGWAAIAQGDDTPRRLNRMTANPIVHMGWFSLLMFAVIGIAWGVMPIDPSRFRNGRRGRVLVSGAGPLMNVGLAIVALTLLVAWLAVGPEGSPLYANLAIFLWMGGWLNLLLALFNMLPVPPLDGAGVLSGLSFRFYQLYQSPQTQMVGMFVVLVLLISGVFSLLFGVCQMIALTFVDGIGGVIGNPDLVTVLAGV